MTVPSESLATAPSDSAPPDPAPSDPAPSDPGRLGVVVLAAGAGTRMRSQLPKVLHGFAGRSMLEHVLAATNPLHADLTAVVVGHGRDAVIAHLHRVDPDALAVVQEEQRGTGHAVRVALQAVARVPEIVLVLPGDAPLLRPETLIGLLAAHRRQDLSQQAAATVLTSTLADPTGYGRVLRAADGTVERIVEHKDATEAERAIDEVSTAIYAFDGPLLAEAVQHLGTDNAQGEEYLPDVVSWLRAGGHVVRARSAPAGETAGVNDRVQLSDAYRVYNRRVVEGHQRNGVTVDVPDLTWIEPDVAIGPDTVVAPNVHLEAGSTIGAGARIGPDSTLRATTVGDGARVERSVTDSVSIGAGCTVGPFAYLRAGAELAANVKVGTFVEVKNSTVGSGSKVPHLSYVGDATIGRRTNIGASTIFANYDGVNKNRSEVGDDVRISSDTTLVAPVRVGDGAYTGAGTVVRGDVPAHALAVSMGPQRNIDQWATRRAAKAVSDRTEPLDADPTTHRPPPTEQG